MSIRTALSDISFMKTLFAAAEAAAHELGDPEMGAEHLVIAALERDDLDRSALAALPLDASRFRSAVVAVHAEALSTVGLTGTVLPITSPPRGVLHSTASAQIVFRDARRSATAQRAPLSALHIVAAAARIDNGTTARALARLGIERATLENLVR